MLYIRTGLPGAGKTLNAIREIDTEHQPDPENPFVRLYKDPDNPDLPPRTIYYHGIPDLKVDRLKSNWVEFNTPDEWFNLPDGSVIVIDEAQGTFGTDIGRARVDKVTRFETHRHQGLDIHLITQHPSLLAPAVRKLAGKHINFIRPYGRTKGIFRHEYEMCIDAPEKRVNFKMAQEAKVELDPSYFGVYKSSSIHTHKPVKPAYLKLIPIYAAVTILPLVLIGFMFWSVISSADEEREQLRKGTTDSPESSEVLPAGSGSSVQTATPAQPPAPSYAETFKPRIEGLPATAPRYDELTKPRDFPRLVCISSTDTRTIERLRPRGFVATVGGVKVACQCHTQQGTRASTPVPVCLDIVTNGIFDDTRQRQLVASGYRQGIGEPVNNAMPNQLHPVDIPRGRAGENQPGGIALTVIPDTSRDGKPLSPL